MELNCPTNDNHGTHTQSDKSKTGLRNLEYLLMWGNKKESKFSGLRKINTVEKSTKSMGLILFVKDKNNYKFTELSHNFALKNLNLCVESGSPHHTYVQYYLQVIKFKEIIQLLTNTL